MAKVYVGVGHGGKDSGAVANGFLEKNLTLSIANDCTAYLRSRGVTVKQSRTTDVYFPTDMKVKDANAWGADLTLDIHINAGGGDGAEIFYSAYETSAKNTVSKSLANNILNMIITYSSQKQSRGLKVSKGSNGDYFGIIRNSNAPAVLVECAFIDSVDIKDIDTAQEQMIMGHCIAKGILKQLGIADVEVKATATPTTAPTATTAKTEKTYTVKSGDSWWGVAKSQLGNGNKMNLLAQYNNKTTDTTLHPGQVLKIPQEV